MDNPSAQQEQAYNDFFSEPNSNQASSSSSNHPDFSGASFAPIGPASTPLPATSNNGAAAGNNTYGSAQNPNAPLPWWKRIFWILALETYQPYFNIDSDDVQYRMLSTVKNINVDDGFWNQVLTGNPSAEGTSPDQELPHPGQQQQRQHTNTSPGNKGPDAYGPFWLATTLIFLLAVTSNISNYLHQSRNENYREDFEYDIVILGHAVWVMYGYTFGVPFALAVIFRVLLTGEGGKVSSALPTFAELMCLYGYSLVPYAFGFVLSGILPFNVVQWLVLIGATGASLLFVLRNLAGRIIGTPMSSAISEFSAAASSQQQVPQHEDDLQGDQHSMDFTGTASGNIDSNPADRNAQMVHHQRAKGTPILGSVIGIHVLFCVILKLGFYHPYATDVPKN
jgi:hypothetical protein